MKERGIFDALHQLKIIGESAHGPNDRLIMDMKVHADTPAVAAKSLVSPISSHNEWDPLEEIIVGRLEGSVIPSRHPVVTCNIPGMAALGQQIVAGMRYPQLMLEPAQQELDGFIKLLQSLGITVTRPDVADHKKKFSTPEFT